MKIMTDEDSSQDRDRPATAILVNHDLRETWHHSVAFDGRGYTTTCGQIVWLAPIRAVVGDLTVTAEVDHPASGWCSEHWRPVQSVQSETLSDAVLGLPSLTERSYNP